MSDINRGQARSIASYQQRRNPNARNRIGTAKTGRGATVCMMLGWLMIAIWAVSAQVGGDSVRWATRGRQWSMMARSQDDAEAVKMPPPRGLPAPGATVFCNKGTFYHWRSDCPLMRYSSVAGTWPQYMPMSRTEAEAAGKLPCVFCGHIALPDRTMEPRP